MVLDTISLGYYIGFLLNISLVLFLVFTGSRHSPDRAHLRTTFFLLSVCLLCCWQGTLFIETRAPLPFQQITVARFLYATIVVATYLAYRMVQEISLTESAPTFSYSSWLVAETAAMVCFTLFTPFVDAGETFVPGSRAITTYGVLFPLYICHVLVCLGERIATCAHSVSRKSRKQFFGGRNTRITISRSIRKHLE